MADTPKRYRVVLQGLRRYANEELNPDQVADVMSVSVSTVRNWLKPGPAQLPHGKIGALIRIHRGVLVLWLNERAEGQYYVDPGPDETATTSTEVDPNG